jgi:hypothetical protein
MRFTKIPENTFEKLQLNAGMLLTSFNPASPAIVQANILGATTGGLTFQATPSFRDNGEDIDNCPKNMKELMEIDDVAVTLSGTLLTIDTASAKKLAAAADVSGIKITPRNDLTDADFSDLWLVGDYSDENGESGGGFFAIHILNALSTGGFQLRTQDKQKGQFAFVFTGHRSMSAQTVVPYELYVSAGTDSAYAVKQLLTHVASTFEGSSVAAAGSFETTLSAETGYTLANVVVLLGGEDVTSSKYNSSTHKVTISGVSGDIEIIATATGT